MFDNNDKPEVPTSSTALAVIPKTSTALAIRYDIVIDSPQSDAAEIADIVVQIRNWRLRGREYRIVTGELLIRLHKLLAKPSSGSFMRYVREECGLPYNTARDYMAEAMQANGHCEILNDVPADNIYDAEVIPYDPNDNTLDNVEIAILAYKEKLKAAEAKAAKPDFLRDFNWKFTGVTGTLADELKAAKAKLGNLAAAQILINAAKAEEVSNELLAA
jgi:hypothetical protein